MGKAFVVFVAALTLTHVSFHAECAEESSGPDNIVGYFKENVTLCCHRGAPGGVVWSYVAPGSGLDEVPVPGRHSYRISSYGRHSLTLENLQRSDAGLYVCRSTHDSEPFDQASAFLVVVADHPTCRSDSRTDHKLTVSCRIVYNGMLNLTLSILRFGDNFTVASRNFTSSVHGSWWHLEGKVPVNSSCQPHACRAQFHSSQTNADVAKNRPTYIEAPCELGPPPECAAELHVSASRSTTRLTTTMATPDVSSQEVIGGPQNTEVINDTTPKTNANDKTSSKSGAAIAMSTIALGLVIVFLVVILFFRCRKSRLQEQQRNSGSGQPDNETPGHGQVQNADKATSPLLMRKDSSTSANAAFSVTDESVHLQTGTAASPENGEPSNRPTHTSNNASTSTSVSDLALCSDDDDDDGGDSSNEKTVVPKAGKERAKAAMTASVPVQDKSM